MYACIKMMLTYANVFRFVWCPASNGLTRAISIVKCEGYCCGISIDNADRVLCDGTAIICGINIYIIGSHWWPWYDITHSRQLSILVWTSCSDHLHLLWNFKIGTQSWLNATMYIQPYANLLFWCNIVLYHLEHIVYMRSILLRCLVARG